VTLLRFAEPLTYDAPCPDCGSLATWTVGVNSTANAVQCDTCDGPAPHPHSHTGSRG
jgi:hypothetical protein